MNLKDEGMALSFHINENAIFSLLIFLKDNLPIRLFMWMKWNNVCEKYFVNCEVKIIALRSTWAKTYMVFIMHQALYIYLLI